ncbi:MAG: Gfo/Idh/MocA family oxidoreductase [Verrucomicrobia bacterium]|nr:Gfo/Idh/MocA family oxidoreductase [Verrucomicrobiota bacterium]MDA1069244.1 Gfo/Idh/MocA family oxidoreductase [Verrucomicrobiota bacterium]
MNTLNQTPDTNRRSFIKSMLAAGVAPLVIRSSLLGKAAPSNMITLGFIGVGGHGLGYNLKSFLQEDDCRAVAVCDVSKDRRQQARNTVNDHNGDSKCSVIADFRELLARDDIDAVVISTPDHWHVTMAIMAMKAGKKVFCEKPTLTIAEGGELLAAVKKYKAVFATGLEDRSVTHYHKMAEAVRNGAIGELRHIQVGLPIKPVFPLEDPADVPDDLDYDLWLGPAPYREYFPSITGAHVWRQIRDFSGGSLTDWGAHLLDTAQVANFSEDSAPIAVSGKGTIPPNSVNSVPQTYEINYTYANGVTMQVVADKPSIRFEGSKGWVGNSGWKGQLEASDLEIYRRKYDPETNKLWPRPPSEHRNFLDSVKSGKLATYSARGLHKLSNVMHIGAISMELARSLKWDPKKESFDDSDANALRRRDRRGHWAHVS